MADEQHTRNLVIGNVTILRDEHGRYSLNTLHKAGGHEDRHRPSQWLRNESTVELIDELKSEGGNSPLETIHGGAKRGTYVLEELAIAYAGWISPQFQLIVIRAFMAMRDFRQQGTIPEFDPFANYPELQMIHRMAIEVAKTRDEIDVVRNEVLDIRKEQQQQNAQLHSQEERIAAFSRIYSPAGRSSCIQWIKDAGKPFLPPILFDNFKAECKRRELPILFRPGNMQWPLPYYTIKTLENAYEEVTKQLSFFRVPKKPRRRA